MKIWYFHGLYKADSLGTNNIPYDIFNLRHANKVAVYFSYEKQDAIDAIWSFKYRNKKNGKV